MSKAAEEIKEAVEQYTDRRMQTALVRCKAAAKRSFPAEHKSDAAWAKYNRTYFRTRQWFNNNEELLIRSEVRSFVKDFVAAKRIAERNKPRRERKYGFFTVTWVLSVLLGSFISWAIKRWLDRRYPK